MGNWLLVWRSSYRPLQKTRESERLPRGFRIAFGIPGLTAPNGGVRYARLECSGVCVEAEGRLLSVFAVKLSRASGETEGATAIGRRARYRCRVGIELIDLPHATSTFRLAASQQ